MKVCRLSLAIEEVIAEPSTYLKETIHMFSNHILHVKPQVCLTKIEKQKYRQIKDYVIKKCCKILYRKQNESFKEIQIDKKIGKKLD